MADPVVATGVNRDERPTRIRRGLAVAAISVLCIASWWVLTTPRLDGGGVTGVSSADHEVLQASGLDESLFAVPADVPGSSTLVFELRNDGPLPLELVEVWPNVDDPGCLWQPSERWFQDEPRYSGVLDERARPAAGAVLAPDAAATLWVTGAHPDPDGCVHGALTSFDDVEVIARIGARTSATRVPLGYVFGYADDLERVRDFYDVRIVAPGETSIGD